MSALQPGQILDGYELKGVLGQGGMGTVFRAVQLSMAREVALKVLAPDLAERDPSFCRRFVDEARAAGRLGHPNIIAVHDVGQTILEERPIFYFAMELVDGEDCKALLKRQGRFDEELLGRIAQALGDVLFYAHSQGIVHRDIKPENIMLTRDGQVKLADLGLAQRVNEPQDTVDGKAQKVMGTPRYMSPEQARGKVVDHRADQYCLGATLFHLITAEPPYQGRSAKDLMRSHVLDPVPDPASIVPVPEPWRRLIMTMMAKRPDDRFADPVLLREAIAAVRQGQIPSRAASTSSLRHLAVERFPLPLVLAGLLGALMLSLVAWLLFSGSAAPGEQEPPIHSAAPSPTAQPDPSQLERIEALIAALPPENEAAIAVLEAQLAQTDTPLDPKASARLQQALATRQQALAQARAQAQAAQQEALAQQLNAVKSHHQAKEWQKALQLLAAIPEELQQLDQASLTTLRDRITHDAEAFRDKLLGQIEHCATLEELQRIRQRSQVVPAALLDQAFDTAWNQKRLALQDAWEKAQAEAQQLRQESADRSWQALLDTLEQGRGSGDFSAWARDAQQASQQQIDPERQRQAQNLADLALRLSDLENALRQYLREQQPQTTYRIGNRIQAITVERADASKWYIRLREPNMSTAVERTRPDVDIEELAQGLWRAQPELRSLLPFLRWQFRLPNGQNPLGTDSPQATTAQETVTAKNSETVSPQEATSLLMDFRQRPQAFSWWDTTETLQSSDAGLRWLCDQAVNRSALTEKSLPTLRLKPAIPEGRRLKLQLTLDNDSFLLVGLRRGSDIVRLGLNTQVPEGCMLMGLLSRNGQAQFDKERGTVLMAQELGALVELELLLQPNGSVDFFLNGNNWLELLPPPRRAVGPFRLSGSGEAELLVQALPRPGKVSSATLIQASLAAP